MDVHIMRKNVLYYNYVPTQTIFCHVIIIYGEANRIKFYTPSWAESGAIQVEIITVGISYNILFQCSRRYGLSFSLLVILKEKRVNEYILVYNCCPLIY